MPSCWEKIYNLSAIASPNLSRTLSAETKTGGSINSYPSDVKLFKIEWDVLVRTSDDFDFID